YVPSSTSRRLLLSMFFCRCHGRRRDLHSFPTRRSSDLYLPNDSPRARSCASRIAISMAAFAIWWPCTWRRSPKTSSATRWRRRRSEEHTSELQSHLNLVCRLLLEKKKNT